MYRGKFQQYNKAFPINTTLVARCMPQSFAWPLHMHSQQPFVTEERAMMSGEMGSWNWGFGFGHWIFGILFWLALILVVAATVKYLIKNN
jgi:hypothetical protein